MTDAIGPYDGETASSSDDVAGLASVIQVDRDEEVAAICGRLDTAPTFAVVIHAPRGNRPLGAELGMRRLQRHAEESGRIVAIATRSSSLAARAREVGIPVARRPDRVRWDSGGRKVFNLGARSWVAPAVGQYVQALVILAVVLLFVGLLLTMAPAGKVVAYPPSETVSELVTITASPDLDQVDLDSLTVPAREVSAVKTMTLVLKTTGKVQVGTSPARATVAITNPSQFEVIVPAGTLLLAGDVAQFELEANTKVPPGQFALAMATAVLPGAHGNVGPNTITAFRAPELAGLKLTNPEAATGGHSETRPAVDAADIVAITAMAKDLGTSESVRQTLVQARPHDAVFLRTARTQVEAGEVTTPAGTPSDVLTLDVRVTVTALAVLADTLDDIARRVLASQHGTGAFIEGSVTALETGARMVNADDGTIRTEIRVSGEFARDLTEGSLRDAVKGKSADSAKSTLSGRYGIEDADVSVSPGWAPWLPRFGFRIDVDLRSRLPGDAVTESAQANAAPTPAASATPRP